jgi:hypothetical protein
MSFASYRAELAAWAMLSQLAPATLGAVSRPATTNAVDPEAPKPEPESRQVRRARLRREMKLRRRRGY